MAKDPKLAVNAETATVTQTAPEGSLLDKIDRRRDA